MQISGHRMVSNSCFQQYYHGNMNTAGWLRCDHAAVFSFVMLPLNVHLS